MTSDYDTGVRLCPALFICAPASGQGKTSVTAALARAHARLGRRVRVFKTGPDFLDPMVLERASGTPVYQLDIWMGGEQDARARLYAAAGDADLILIEGAMGLFDGEPSSADLARSFGLRVLVVIDGHAMAQTFGALAHGLASYRDDVVVDGVVANRVAGAYHATLLRGSLPASLRWYGALSSDAGLALPERHLGLVAASEVGELDARLDALADALGQDALLLPTPSVFHPPAAPPSFALSLSAPLDGCRIAIARDAAFAFIYPANLDVLRQAGATLHFFSPIAGDALPACDAVWLPGGYPELHLATLSARHDLHRALREHVGASRPLLAECGGLLYALDELAHSDGHEATMAGLISGHATMQPRVVALGMQEVQLPEGVLRGHAFHYASATVGVPPLVVATNPNGGPTCEAVYRHKRMTASFMHFYFPSNPDAAIGLFSGRPSTIG